jgi:hypothetical protein
MADDLVSVLIEAFSKGDLKAALDANADQLTFAVAAQARKIYETAFFTAPRDEMKATVAICVAIAIFERLGQHRNQIGSQIDSLRIFFERAKTPDEYKWIRDQILPLQGFADSKGDEDLAFELQVNAADCSYFAFTAKDIDLTWLKTALADLVGACKRAPGFEKTPAFARMVDLIANTAKRAITRVMPDEDRSVADKLLSELAADANVLVPVDFVFFNDAEQTSRIAYWLDQLDKGYGNAQA